MIKKIISWWWWCWARRCRANPGCAVQCQDLHQDVWCIACCSVCFAMVWLIPRILQDWFKLWWVYSITHSCETFAHRMLTAVVYKCQRLVTNFVQEEDCRTWATISIGVGRGRWGPGSQFHRVWGRATRVPERLKCDGCKWFAELWCSGGEKCGEFFGGHFDHASDWHLPGDGHSDRFLYFLDDDSRNPLDSECFGVFDYQHHIRHLALFGHNSAATSQGMLKHCLLCRNVVLFIQPAFRSCCWCCLLYKLLVSTGPRCFDIQCRESTHFVLKTARIPANLFPAAQVRLCEQWGLPAHNLTFATAISNLKSPISQNQSPQPIIRGYCKAFAKLHIDLYSMWTN